MGLAQGDASAVALVNLKANDRLLCGSQRRRPGQRNHAHTMPTRALILAHTRAWIGTPYHQQASTLGVGADCLGLIRGVFRTLYGREAQSLPAYTRDWAEAIGEETMLAAARQHLIEITPAAAQPGDVLIFRFRRATMAKHAAILSGPASMIHALEDAAVCEVPLNSWWRRRIAGAFAFPGVAD
jgi:NlpC/P60 family putative phage cell wall peptidase